MLRNLFIILIVILPVYLNAQTLSGKVYRANSDTTIPGASVYYGGSMQGTSTNAKGEFNIEAKPGKIPLVVSCVGYYSTTVNDYTPAQPLKIYLNPKIHELREVSIGFNGPSNEELERMFKQEFIGVSYYALNCTITNMDDIELNYDAATKTLTAFCDKPIKIDNKKLGYHISYFLDQFKKTPKFTLFSGNYIFTEAIGSANPKRIKHNREDAYNGSRMEFIRALWKNTLKKEHYKIYTPYLKSLDADSILLVNDKGEKFIRLKYEIIISHNNNYSTTTHLSQTVPNCYIDANGFYTAGLLWHGTMGMQRVGDMLPFEYRSASDIKDSLNAADSVKSSRLMSAARPVSTKNEPKDIRLFKSIVLAPNNLLDARLVVKKWDAPIRYKIYGTFDKSRHNDSIVIKRIDTLFAQLSKLTGLEISKAATDAEVNFYIIAGSLDKYKSVITPDAMEYLQRQDKTGGVYYATGQNGFDMMVQLVRPQIPRTLPNILSTVQQQIINGMGFFGIAEGYSSSLFAGQLNNLPEKIQPLDARIIQNFYNPAIRSGMTERELDEALAKSGGLK
jgi:hypothetical protein